MFTDSKTEMITKRETSPFSVLSEVRKTFKEKGFKGVVKRYGWKIFAAFFAYYLVRDVTLYIIFPYLVAKHLLS